MFGSLLMMCIRLLTCVTRQSQQPLSRHRNGIVLYLLQCCSEGARMGRHGIREDEKKFGVRSQGKFGVEDSSEYGVTKSLGV